MAKWVRSPAFKRLFLYLPSSPFPDAETSRGHTYRKPSPPQYHGYSPLTARGADAPSSLQPASRFGRLVRLVKSFTAKDRQLTPPSVDRRGRGAHTGRAH